MKPKTALLVALALGPSTRAIAQQPPPAVPDPLAKVQSLSITETAKALKWNEPADPVRIVGPIYFVGTRGLGVYLITTPQGHILINSGMPPSGPMIEASIRKLGFNPRDVKLLLANHAHVDHVGGHAYLKKVTGARVAMMAAEAPLLESGAKADFHYANDPDFAFDPVKVDQVLRDGDTIKLRDVTLTALLTPGHTKGSATFTTTVVDAGKTYTVVIANGASVNPGYRLARDPSYPGIADDYRRTLHTFETLKPDIWLLPHNQPYDFDRKLARAAKDGPAAWVDPEGYRKWAAAQRNAFEAALTREGSAPQPPGSELLQPRPSQPK